ncbi:Uncharacterised protein [Moraxella lacunata]|uniref:Uncharacterized protein n=1 Tax=Moraxella lacunata TaxID=477 RepID=A0A378T5Y8_MORLA|nr:hypothetical protein [Moraxella lacunata]STZ55577.1 Uncharacterised protein [Moraxella lacunata]
MGLPKDKVKPAFNYTYPSERDYADESKSALGNMQMTDPAKSGGDYGIKDPEVTEELTGKKSETGNGA